MGIGFAISFLISVALSTWLSVWAGSRFAHFFYRHAGKMWLALLAGTLMYLTALPFFSLVITGVMNGVMQDIEGENFRYEAFFVTLVYAWYLGVAWLLALGVGLTVIIRRTLRLKEAGAPVQHSGVVVPLLSLALLAMATFLSLLMFAFLS